MPYKDQKKLYEAQKRHRIRIRERLLDFLCTKKCIDCGEKDPIVLDFDHIDAETKTRNVARMLSGHWSWDSVFAEIEKCEVRCANCHRRKTYLQFGFFGRTKRPL
ncbi:MAG: hypothetical protein A2854_02950 [Parcubacteria group bacterium RIFCSPHIGHO2_01_FULL_56_18]|nr:MAG: hypothetical protein A2854_02950 [Parcubacteria group bacterium RIFCSPHIGHO2_01_FULL_56_18]